MSKPERSIRAHLVDAKKAGLSCEEVLALVRERFQKRIDEGEPSLFVAAAFADWLLTARKVYGVRKFYPAADKVGRLNVPGMA